jgi:hypothetical protein
VKLQNKRIEDTGIALSVANVAIFFLDWRLKSAAGEFFGA